MYILIRIRSSMSAGPPQQERSRRTLDQLLAAAEAVLSRDGLEGTTVPAIAAHAGLSVGAVYRRFPDKDALVREVCERFFERGLQANRASLEPARWEGMALARMARLLIGGIVAGYRQHRGLLRALYRFVETHEDRTFRRRADELSNEALRRMGDLLLVRKSEIGHPRPERAVRLGLLGISFALRGMMLSDPRGLHPRAAELVSEDDLAGELTRMYLGFLGTP
jgi:AcrR family transcriptional regulator